MVILKMEQVLHRCAESVVFKKDEFVLVKHRLKKGYRLPELEAHISAQRQRQEVRNMKKAEQMGIRVPRVYAADEQAMTISMEFLKSFVTLKEALRGEESDAVKELVELCGHYVGLLHNGGIVHGDLTSSNIMVDAQGRSCALIDFGLSSSDQSIEGKAVDLYVFEKSLLCEAREEDFLSQIIGRFKEGYKNSSKAAAAVMGRLEKVKARGRKKVAFG